MAYKAAGLQDSNPATPPGQADSSMDLEDQCTLTLELLQWKRGIPEGACLVEPLQAVVRKLMEEQPPAAQNGGSVQPASRPSQQMRLEAGHGSLEGGGVSVKEVEEDGAGAQPQVPRDYRMQLALDALRYIVEESADVKTAEVCLWIMDNFWIVIMWIIFQLYDQATNSTAAAFHRTKGA